MAAVTCPVCQTDISEDDFNVSKDIAYCRACNSTHEFSAIIKQSELEEVDLTEMPKYLRIIPDYQGEVLQYKKISGVVFFLLFFELFWTGGIIAAFILPTADGGEEPSFLPMIPFFLISVILFFVILTMLMGKRTIKVGDYETVIKYGLGGFSLKKMFNNDDFKSVELQKGSVSVNNVAQDDICIELENAKTIRFGALMEKNSKNFVAAYLNSKLNDRS